MKFLPLREFCADRVNGALKVRCLVSRDGESELPGRAVTAFVWSSKKRTVSVVLREERVFAAAGSARFLLGCCFQWALLGAVLVGVNRLVFWKKPVTEDSVPVPPQSRHCLLGMKTSLGVAGVGSYPWLAP